MNKIELAEHLRENYKPSNRSIWRRKNIFGIGINDSDYMTKPMSEDGDVLSCPAYKAWVSMLKRCYSEKDMKDHPTYKECITSPKWIFFMSFREWWIENYKEGYDLDKDLLVPFNKEYGPEFCIYVPRSINVFTTSPTDSRFTGATYNKARKKWTSYCNNPFTGELEYLGRYDLKIIAHKLWVIRKLEIALEYKIEMDKIDPRIYESVLLIIKSRAEFNIE